MDIKNPTPPIAYMLPCETLMSAKPYIAVAAVVLTSAYGASPLLVSRASRSAVASFSQLEADRKVLERDHRPGSTGPVASNSPPSLLLLL